jgi:hypothetical protein
MGVLIVIFFGCIPFVILTCSALWSRSRAAVIGWAIFAMGLMAAECFVLRWASNFGESFGGTKPNYDPVAVAIVLCVFALLIYFGAVFDRLMGRK